jgi:hypothetical protein
MYPIVPSFQDWRFPHDRFNIPDFWPPAAAATATSPLSIPCGISNTNYAVDEAHLLPQRESTWFQDNHMSRYGAGSLPDMNNRANILPLRKDIYHCFDNRWFVIIPKMTNIVPGSTTPSIQYITNIISQDAAELWPAYHNTLVGSLHTKSPAYLFARFAWAILFRVTLFVISGYPRQVVRIHRDAKGKIEYKAEKCSGTMLSSMYGGGGSLAATPQKGMSIQGSTAGEEEIPVESSGDDSDMDTDDNLWDTIDDWRGEGRKRRHESLDETVPDTKLHLPLHIEAELREALCKGILEQ